MRDFLTGNSAVPVLGPVVLAADNTPVAIDLAGWDGGTLIFAVGVGGITFDATNKVEFKLSHGDTTTVGAHTAVTQSDVVGVTVGAGGIVRSLIAAHAAATNVSVGYVGIRRYVSVLADFSGTHGTGTPISVTLFKGGPLVVLPA